MNPFISITDRITVTVPIPDTGQGVRTAVAMMVAEELRVHVADLVIEQAEGDPDTYGPQISANSNSMRTLHEPIRTAAATVRHQLVLAAANRWHVPEDQCRADDGAVHHDGRSFTYQELAAEAARLEPPQVSLTPRGEWRVLGTETVGRVDAADIVSGRAKYATDQQADLVAVVARPPWIGATPTGFTSTAHAVQLGSGIALLAKTTYEAIKARDNLTSKWTGGTPEADSDVWLEELKSKLPTGITPKGPYIEKIYTLPMLAHAPMEPLTATAKVTDDEVTVWAPTQAPDWLRNRLAQDFANVTVIPTRAGGAFGRKFEDDFVLEAVQLARHTGKTVKVLWTRDDDMRHDSYRPMSVHRIRATVNDEGLPTWRDHAVSTWPLTVVQAMENPLIVKANGDHFPYDVPGEVHVNLTKAPLRTGFWRSVYAGPFAYAEEMFISELDTPLDQLERRTRLLTDTRRRKALTAAAEAHDGEPQAVACHENYGSVIAVVAETRHDGRIKVTAAVDVGPALHPSGVRAQVEGAIMDAVSTTRGARITVKQGKVEQESFRAYPWARVGDTPDIEVVLVPSDAPVGGLGELAYPAAAAAFGFLSHGKQHTDLR